MSDELRFAVLGPLLGRRASQPLDLGPAPQQALLAALILSPDRPLSPRELLDGIWGPDRPGGDEQLVAPYLDRLRQVLDPAGPGAEASVLLRDPDGYRLRANSVIVDHTAVARTLRQARERRLAREPAEAMALISDAEAQCRGEPLHGLPGPLLAARRQGLAELVLRVHEERIEAELALGRHVDAIGDLVALHGQHPHREQLAGLLMLALYRSGRQADALAVFARTRQHLVDEYGLNPGPELQELHQAVLRADPDLAAAPGRGVGQTAGALSAPAVGKRDSLPAITTQFLGRDREIGWILGGLLDGDDPRDAGVRIVAIDGMAGIGKTTVGVRAAQRAAESFPDGQLFCDLHGHTPGREPLQAGEALDQLLRSAGVRGEQIPADVDARSQLWRATVAGRRLLLLLDNAASAAQVRPLLPGSAGNAVLITSRQRLGGLDVTRHLALRVLPDPVAAELFSRLAGQDGAVTDAATTRQAARLCGGLPLALSVAAARLRHRPGWTVRDLVARLERQTSRLAELAAEDRSVEAAFDISYDHLEPDEKRMFRLLGALPGTDIEVRTAAAVAGLAPPLAERVLERLLDAHLLQQRTPYRYYFHDLIREHATTLSERKDDAVAEQDEALTRLLAYYLDVTRLADHYVRPGAPPHPGERLAVAGLPAIASFDDALAWLDAEHANLIRAVTEADRRHRYSHVLALAQSLSGYQRVRRHVDDWKSSLRLALSAARALGNSHAEAEVLNGLSSAHLVSGSYSQAIELAEAALPIAQHLADRAVELQALVSLAGAERLIGRPRSAVPLARTALAIAEEIGDRRGVLAALRSLLVTNAELGDYRAVMDDGARCLALAREIDDRRSILSSLAHVGRAHQSVGRLDEAAGELNEAVAMSAKAGDVMHSAYALTLLGTTREQLGDIEGAIRCHQRALTIAESCLAVGDELEVRVRLGQTYLAAGRVREATEEFEYARGRARRDTLSPYDAVRIDDGLASCLERRGNTAEALDLWRAVLPEAEGMSIPEADSIRDRLRHVAPAQ